MEALTYRGYEIRPTDPVPPIPCWREFAWEYVHQDYDGPEDGRCGHAKSPEAAKAEIDEREDEEIVCGLVDALKRLLENPIDWKAQRLAREAIAKATGQ